MRSEFETGGLNSLVGPRMMFSELADWYTEDYMKDAEYVDGRKIAGIRSYDTRASQVKILKDYLGQAPSRNHLLRSRKVQSGAA